MIQSYDKENIMEIVEHLDGQIAEKDSQTVSNLENEIQCESHLDECQATQHLEGQVDMFQADLEQSDSNEQEEYFEFVVPKPIQSSEQTSVEKQSDDSHYYVATPNFEQECEQQVHSQIQSSEVLDFSQDDEELQIQQALTEWEQQKLADKQQDQSLLNFELETFAQACDLQSDDQTNFEQPQVDVKMDEFVPSQDVALSIEDFDDTAKNSDSTYVDKPELEQQIQEQSEQILDTVVLHSVLLYRNSGRGGSGMVKVQSGQPMPKAQAPEKEGAVFLGFFDDLNGGKQYYDRYMNSACEWDKNKSDLLYARWLIL
ncbi:MAG: InlB B-repeat-containing protein [Clostridiales bacterium]|jgi:hypothetical protein|nr:InlB B-repeat-containing protein [Clostridiales bacterium]